MKKRHEVFIIPLIFALLLTVSVAIYGYSTGNHRNIKDMLLLFGLVSFFGMIMATVFKSFLEMIRDFFAYDIKGKILLIVIFLGYVLRAFYQMSLSK